MRTFLFFLFVAFASCSKEPPPKPTPRIAISAGKCVQQDASLFKEYVGHVIANLSLEIKAQIPGIITGKYFEDGQEVNEGDLLFTIDTRPYRAALSKAEAALARSIADLNYSKDTVTRYAELVQDDYVAQLDFDKYTTNVAVGEANIKQNLADIETAKLNLEYCVIRAPWKGITGNTNIDIGNYVKVGGDTSLTTMKQVTPIEVLFIVPEKDLPLIQCRYDQSELITQVRLGEETFQGDLIFIDNTVNENTGTILMKAKIPNEDKRLWPGEFVDIRLILGEKKGATLVPIQAVQYGQDGSYVFVIKSDNTVELRSVAVGQREQESFIVESGLQPGEAVVLEGQINLYPGASVEIQP